jgi:DNA polymerase
MSLITIDFETYYNGKIKLGFKHQTTEEYVRDKRFEVIGVGVKVDDEPTVWVSGSKDKIREYLSALDWSNSALLCHNTMFDGCILSWHYGITPAFMYDTLCIARAVHGVEAGGSLKALAERYKIGIKGDDVIAAEGKARLDFNKEELARYGEYCKNDVDLTLKLFKILSSDFPDNEMALIDMTLRMFTHPVFLVDDALLQDRYDELKEEKQTLLEGLMGQLNCETAEAVRKRLASNKQFAEILVERGVKVPMKESKTTGKQTYALAKNDEEFINLTEDNNVVIQQLCSVRLGTKSTIEESRIERFIEVGKRNKGRLPIPLKYYGAHTGRWAGSDKVNFQNLPSRDKKKKTLKNAVIAPDDHIIINCDSSQIEARVLVWLAGQADVVKQFSDGEDVYSLFATKIYDRPITKANPIERFVGKTCILGLGYGTGALKLQHTLKTQPPGAVVTEDEAKSYVDTYRTANDKVIKLWRTGDKAIADMASWPTVSEEDATPIKPYYYGKTKCLKITQDGVILPNGLSIRYPELKLDTSAAESKYIYKSRKGPVSLWGGALVENVVQALARIIVGEQMIEINKRYRVALTVHDAAVIVVPEAEKDEALAYVTECMSTPPKWARGLPVTCEAKYAQTYGEC